MKLEGKNILVISPDDWGNSWVSKHHYSFALALRNNKVFFLNPSNKIVDTRPHKNLEIVSGEGLPRGIRFYPAAIRRRFHRRCFSRLQQQLATKFDLVFSFDSSRYLDLSAFVTSAVSIFFMADFNPGTPWQIPVATADLSVGCSHYMVEQMKKIEPRSRFIHHGYAKSDPGCTPYLSDGKNVVYSGNLAHGYLDANRILALVSCYPNVSFHFFGDDGTGNLGRGFRVELAKKLESYSNCFLHGVVSASALPAIYRAADVLLLAHSPGFHQRGNPHKMMEYLASGTPVLSTALKEYQELEEFLVFEDDFDGYVAALERLLAGEYSEFAEQRKTFAEANTYDAQIERLESWLSDLHG